MMAVTRAQLEALAATAPRIESDPPYQRTADSHGFDVGQWLTKHGLAVKHHSLYDGGWKWVLESCPFNPDHGHDSAVFERANGCLGFRCLHNGCTGRNWHDLRAVFEPKVERSRKQRLRKISIAPGIEPATETGEIHDPFGAVAPTVDRTYPPVSAGEQLPQALSDFIHECLDAEEYGDGALFARLYDNRAVFDHAESLWHLWDGNAWAGDRGGIVHRLVAGQLAAQYLHEAAEAGKQAEAAATDAERADLLEYMKKLLGRATALRKINRNRNVLSFAATFLPLPTVGWDANPDLLAVVNGVVDLTTGEARPGAPTDYIRTFAPTEWKGLQEPAPRWEQFTGEILEQDEPKDTRELPSFLQRLLGYGITGHRTEHVLPVLWGAGRNGKDTLLESLVDVLGDLAEPVSTDVLMARKDHAGAADPHLYDLRGKRLVWASETNEGARLNPGQVKLITGGGTIKARALYANLVKFAPTHTVMLVTNERPHAPADDYALWKRLLLVPFRRAFVDQPKDPHERQKDPALKEKLVTERSGILAWLVRGTLAWRCGGLQPPAVVAQATDEYRAEEDTIQQFINDCCLVGDTLEAGAKGLFDAYHSWAPTDKMTPTAFGRRLAKRFTKARRNHGVVYIGVGLPGQPSQAVITNVPSSAAESVGFGESVGFVGETPQFSHENTRACGNYDINPTNYTPAAKPYTQNGAAATNGVAHRPANVLWEPTGDGWEEVPVDTADIRYVLVNGLEIRMDLGNGARSARWIPTDAACPDCGKSLTEPWHAVQYAGGGVGSYCDACGKAVWRSEEVKA